MATFQDAIRGCFIGDVSETEQGLAIAYLVAYVVDRQILYDAATLGTQAVRNALYLSWARERQSMLGQVLTADHHAESLQKEFARLRWENEQQRQELEQLKRRYVNKCVSFLRRFLLVIFSSL
eukprot:TRINITY_DN9824_c0_g1_i1.p1 TRINITY_DN9824_c0_g1~~TRINITY_DN9824_c0_g1_i1.p1  ORF type:complete len:123 (+),score=0.46 TRINITY_DN9824_c0_g1_i1:16-384(+)